MPPLQTRTPILLLRQSCSSFGLFKTPFLILRQYVQIRCTDCVFAIAEAQGICAFECTTPSGGYSDAAATCCLRKKSTAISVDFSNIRHSPMPFRRTSQSCSWLAAFLPHQTPPSSRSDVAVCARLVVVQIPARLQAEIKDNSFRAIATATMRGLAYSEKTTFLFRCRDLLVVVSFSFRLSFHYIHRPHWYSVVRSQTPRPPFREPHTNLPCLSVSR